MASFFFDSSAIVKRYLTEVGSAWVRSLTDPAASHDIYLVHITSVEVVSALVRQAPPLPPNSLSRALADFKQDVRSQYHMVVMNDLVLARAMSLAETRRLRAYDAVQLGAALELFAVAQATRLPALTFISADAQLNAAAVAEGMTLDNPLNHP